MGCSRTVIGIDTGGTYTDAVLLDLLDRKILAWAKVRTTRQDLRACIGGVLKDLLGKNRDARNASSVNLSTTLATNAIAEERLRPVCMILAGYDKSSFETWDFGKTLSTGNVIFVQGGHNRLGDESADLDEDAVRKTATLWKDRVEAFAVSSLFGNRNPIHEIRIKNIIQEATSLPCTCGHEITGKLNALSRASTAALNAGLVPIIDEWLDSVESVLSNLGVGAPLSVVRGDGSLVSSAWAKSRPVETVLSGPAASAIGALFLSGSTTDGDVAVLDMGGTTTDLAILNSGSLKLTEKGARVGRFRAMVPSGEIRTIALGGDSQVLFRHDGSLVLGPKRVTPLCVLKYGINDELEKRLRQLLHQGNGTYEDMVFLLPSRPLDPGSDSIQKRILDLARNSLFSLSKAASEFRNPNIGSSSAMEMVNTGIMELSAFTPTDALCAMGRTPFGNRLVARNAARLLAPLGGFAKGMDLCRAVLQKVSTSLSLLVIKTALDHLSMGEATSPEIIFREKLAEKILLNDEDGSILSLKASLKIPILGAGAPTGHFLPGASRFLKTRYLIPEGSPVANAAGAAAAAFRVRKGVLIIPKPHGDGFRAYLPSGIEDFSGIDEALIHVEAFMKEWLAQESFREGKEKVQVEMSRQDNRVNLKGGSSCLLDIKLWFEIRE